MHTVSHKKEVSRRPFRHSEGRRQAVLFLIDVEPDARQPARPAPVGEGWRGTTTALRLVSAFRAKLANFARDQVRFNWFFRFDPQISDCWGEPDWIARAFPELLDTVWRHGDYCGIHPHLWRWHDENQVWFNDFASEEWGRICLRQSVEAYRRVFGTNPSGCRFGDRWLSNFLVEEMRLAGIKYDLTLEPGRRNEAPCGDSYATASLPDYRRAPLVPYLPSEDSYLKPVSPSAAASDLLMIPLSTVAVWRFSKTPPFVRRHLVGPNLVNHHFPVILNSLSKASGNQHNPLVVAFRTGDLANNLFEKDFVANLNAILSSRSFQQMDFTTVPDAIDRFPLGARVGVRGRYTSPMPTASRGG